MLIYSCPRVKFPRVKSSQMKNGLVSVAVVIVYTHIKEDRVDLQSSGISAQDEPAEDTAKVLVKVIMPNFRLSG